MARVGAVNNCKQKGQIDEQDALNILRYLARLHKELFGKYEEFVADGVRVLSSN
jgi:hypothetical protein